MDHQTNTNLAHAEEEILNPTVSDEALEAAAERGVLPTFPTGTGTGTGHYLTPAAACPASSINLRIKNR